MAHSYALGSLCGGHPGSEGLVDAALKGLTGILHDDVNAQINANGTPAPTKTHAFVILAAASATYIGRPGAKETASYGAVKVDMETVFRESDVISVHTPSLPATQGMIGAKYFRMTKDGVWFINSARGAVVDADAMIAELRTGRINAILDVTDPDEPLSADSPLWDMPNVILTPHIAGSEGTEPQGMGENVVNELTRMIKGEPIEYSD